MAYLMRATAPWFEITDRDRAVNLPFFTRVNEVWADFGNWVDDAWVLAAEAPCHCERLPEHHSRQKCLPCRAREKLLAQHKGIVLEQKFRDAIMMGLG